MPHTSAQKMLLGLSAGIVLILALSFVLPILLPSFFGVTYGKDNPLDTSTSATGDTADIADASTTEPFVPSYVATPSSVKAIYMTSWVAGTPSIRTKVVNVLDTTEANSLVIDVKDYSGRISFKVSDPELVKIGSQEIRDADLPQFIETLHKKGIYVIARIAVFQDAYYVKLHPNLAVKNLAGTDAWKDRKGISWIDPGAQEYWNYIVRIGREARAIGFDELNFDYIRYPSDGNMKDISYQWSATTPKPEILKNFYSFLHDQFVPAGTEKSDNRVKISADLFGLTTTASDDLGIGQVLVDALPYFDYVAPMVYPSHFGAGYDGFKNPAAHPYDVIHSSMGTAVARAKAASTSPLKLRPWLQDFDLGADYTATEVRAQIQATYDVGLDSWMIWSASNVYSSGGLLAQ